MIILTTQKTDQFQRIANDNKHLLKENEIIVVKNDFGKRKYRKNLDNLKLIV
jgi:hypothetical protein